MHSVRQKDDIGNIKTTVYDNINNQFNLVEYLESLLEINYLLYRQNNL